MDIVIFSTLWIACVVALLASLYVYIFKDKNDYKKARVEIFAYVKGYKQKCRGNNRYIVTVETLQDAFREYDTKVINQVWLDLVQNKIIEVDPHDGAWCVR